MTEKREDPAAELEKAHEHWQDIFENGCFDPLYTDGINLNLVRNHMIYYRRMIEDQCGSGEKPAVYDKPIPDEVDMDYMVNSDEIMKRALDFFMQCSFMQEMQNLLHASDYLSQQEMSDLKIWSDINDYMRLGKAILDDDYLTMRNLSWNTKEKIQEIMEANEKLMNRLDKDGEQMSLFDIKM